MFLHSLFSLVILLQSTRGRCLQIYSAVCRGSVWMHRGEWILGWLCSGSCCLHPVHLSAGTDPCMGHSGIKNTHTYTHTVPVWRIQIVTIFSFSLWRSDSSFRFFVFFFVYICQFGVHVLQAIGITGWGARWENTLDCK